MRWWCLLVGVVLLFEGHARAETPDAQVERLSNQAVLAYRSGDFAHSLDLLQRAFQIRPVPALLYNMAKTYEKLDNPSKAIDYYRFYLSSEEVDPRLRGKAEARISALQSEVDATRRSAAADEAAKAAAARAAKVSAARAAAAKAAADAAAAEERARLLAPTSEPATAEAIASPAPRSEPGAASRRRRRVEIGMGIGVAVLGAGAIGAGVALYYDANSLHSQFEQSQVESDRRRLRDDAQLRGILSDVAYGVGGALAVTGAVLFIHGLVRERPRPVALAPFGSSHGAGLVMEGRF